MHDQTLSACRFKVWQDFQRASHPVLCDSSSLDQLHPAIGLCIGWVLLPEQHGVQAGLPPLPTAEGRLRDQDADCLRVSGMQQHRSQTRQQVLGARACQQKAPVNQQVESMIQSGFVSQVPWPVICQSCPPELISSRPGCGLPRCRAICS